MDYRVDRGCPPHPIFGRTSCPRDSTSYIFDVKIYAFSLHDKTLVTTGYLSIGWHWVGMISCSSPLSQNVFVYRVPIVFGNDSSDRGP